MVRMAERPWDAAQPAEGRAPGPFKGIQPRKLEKRVRNRDRESHRGRTRDPVEMPRAGGEGARSEEDHRGRKRRLEAGLPPLRPDDARVNAIVGDRPDY